VAEVEVVAVALGVKQGNVLVFAAGDVGRPGNQVVLSVHLSVVVAFLVYLQHLRIGEHFFGERIELGHIAAKNQRGATDGPQAHQGILFVLGKSGGTVEFDLANREHVGIRKMTGASVGRPRIQPFKHGVQQAPTIPKIIRDAPHIGVIHDVCPHLDGCSTR